MKKALGALQTILICLFVISFALAIPITLRPFYYAQIKALDLEHETGYTYDEIKTAFDDIMNFLHGKAEFKTGVLKYSESGKAHFQDCKRLFMLDYAVLAISLLLIVILFFLRIRPNYFVSALASIGMFAALGIWGAIDFYSLFVLFHAVFFPGKDNWVFDPSTDEIINILPERFFLNCGILIIGAVLALSALFLLIGIFKHGNSKNNRLQQL